MKYYTIQNENLLIAENRQALERFYDKVLELPEDYEEGNYIVIDDNLVLNPDWEEEQAKIRQEEFYNKFLATSKGNYRLQPKGYSNAQQSVDTINGMVNALNGLTQQIAQMVIFYPTPDFTKEEECTEEWLISHQYNAEPMTKEEWTDFYIEFSSLYAMNQYKKANENVN